MIIKEDVSLESEQPKNSEIEISASFVTSHLSLPVVPIRYATITFNFGTYTSGMKESVLAGKILVPSRRNEENPHIAFANKAVINWLIKKNLAKAEDIPKLQGVNFAGLFPTSLRRHSANDLILLTMFTSFLFILDDIIDKQLPNLNLSRYELDEELRSVFKTFEDILNGVYKQSSEIPISAKFPKSKAFNSAFFDIYTGMSELQHHVSNSDVVHQFKDYFKAIRTEVKRRSSKSPLSLPLYRDMRIKTGAVPITFAFIAYIKGFNFKEAIESEDELRLIMELAAIILCFHNDLHSFDKEKGEGEHSNLIQVLLDKYKNKLNPPDNPMQTAFDEAIDLCNEEMHSFFIMVRDLKNSLPKDHPFLEFIEIMEECIIDDNDWKSTRYETKATGYRYEYKEEEDFLPEKVKSNDSEGAVLLTKSLLNKNLGTRLVQEIASFAKHDTEESIKQAKMCLQRIAVLTKVGLIKPDELRYLVEQIMASTLFLGKEIAEEFAKVMNSKFLINLSYEILTSELIKVISACRKILATKDSNAVEEITHLIRNLFRQDSFAGSLLSVSSKQRENANFTEDFIAKLALPMILPLVQDLAMTLHSEHEHTQDHKEHERSKKRHGRDKLIAHPSVRLTMDYSNNTRTILGSIMRMFYFESLKQYSSNVSPVPDIMVSVASAVYRSLLQDVNSTLSGIFDTEKTIPVTFMSEEMGSEVTADVHEFLVYMVGLYLNLRVLTPSYWDFVMNLLKLKDTKFLELIEKKFYSPEFGQDYHQTLQKELNKLIEMDSSHDEDLSQLQKELKKYARASNVKNELEKNLKTYAKDFLAAFHSKNSQINSKCPTLCGYLFLLINYKELMKNHRESLAHEIRMLQKVLDDGIVEWCIQGMVSLLKVGPSSPEAKEEIVKGKELKRSTNAKNKDLLLDELRKDIKMYYGPYITTLYAKLSIYFNRKNDLSAQKEALINFNLNKNQLANMLKNPVILPTDIKVYEKIRLEACSKTVKIICEDKITSLFKQLPDPDPIKFSIELNNLASYIFIETDQADVVRTIKDLCRETIDWLEKIMVNHKKQTPQIYCDILVCLTYYAAVFDVDHCPSLERIGVLRKKIGQEHYNYALTKFKMKPIELVCVYYKQQEELLTRQLEEAKITASKPFMTRASKVAAELIAKKVVRKIDSNRTLKDIKLNLLKSNSQSTEEESIVDIPKSTFFAKRHPSRKVPKLNHRSGSTIKNEEVKMALNSNSKT